jgi:CelD/BcsL family acetyltransferase involved in cellulose biosynthesis
MRDLGTPVYPKSFFRRILEEFPENTCIASVYKGDLPVASGFLAGFKDRLEIPWASSVRDYNRLSPNMLLYWSCLKYGCEKGYATFDFGRSTRGESTYRFKEQWGAAPYPMVWSYWVRRDARCRSCRRATPNSSSQSKYEAAAPAVDPMIGPRIIGNIP